MSEVKDVTINEVINEVKKHNRKADTKLILKAYNYANDNHKGQLRKSGEPYIIHPLQVAYILATIELDESTICAALLHDVVEDTQITHQDIINEFGQEIADMVAGVTKLGTMQFTTVEEMQVEDYIIRQDKSNGTIILELPENSNTDRVVGQIALQGKFEIVDHETDEVLMTNDDIKSVIAGYGTISTGSTAVFININFNKEGIEK